MPATRSNHPRHPTGDVGCVLPVGAACIYRVDRGHLGVLAPKSAALERRLRAIRGVRLVDAEPGQTNAILPAIKLMEVRAALLAHGAPERKPPTGPTIALRRGRVW